MELVLLLLSELEGSNNIEEDWFGIVHVYECLRNHLGTQRIQDSLTLKTKGQLLNIVILNRGYGYGF